MSSPTLLSALIALFEADATLSSDFTATGGLWTGGIPEEEDGLPVCALMPHDEVPTWTPEGSTREDAGAFDFVLYSADLDDAETLAQHIFDVFDPKSGTTRGQTPPGCLVRLDVTAANTTHVRRMGYQVRKVDYKTASGSWAWEITLPYKSYVEKLI